MLQARDIFQGKRSKGKKFNGDNFNIEVIERKNKGKPLDKVGIMKRNARSNDNNKTWEELLQKD